MRLCPSLLLLANLALATSGTRWLQLCDKGPSAPDSGTIAWEDAPVRTDLLDSLKGRGWTIHRIYKWENKVSAAPPSKGEAALPACVGDAGAVARGVPMSRPKNPAVVAARTTGVDEYTLLLGRIWDSLGITQAHAYLDTLGSLPGAGITIAFIDDIFQLGHKVLDSVDLGDSWDYVRGGSVSWDTASSPWPVSKDNMHGTQTSGLVASRWSELPGIAPYAKFLLYRTENDAVEDSTEEGSMAEALVRAEEHGAQVVSTSLGYLYDDNSKLLHDPSAYDGRTLVDSRAATTAARHGIVVVASAGNGGTAGSIGSPADADSILTVGAVDMSDSRCSFSSWGPTYDQRRKPDVVAYGCSVPVAGTTDASARIDGSGTSYATPLVAGMAALALQINSLVAGSSLAGNAMLEAFRSAGTRSGNPDASTGWGVPSLARLLQFKGVLSARPASVRLVWHRPYAGSPWKVSFNASAALADGHLGFDLRDLRGRVLYRWEGAWRSGMSWTPFSTPRPGVLVARWWGAYGEGVSNFLVVP